jgi:hypothetical protein
MHGMEEAVQQYKITYKPVYHRLSSSEKAGKKFEPVAQADHSSKLKLHIIHLARYYSSS